MINKGYEKKKKYYNLLFPCMQTKAFIWCENVLGHLPAPIFCVNKRTVFRELNWRKTVSFEEQIIFEDKYMNIFSHQKEAVYYPSNIFSQKLAIP